MLRNLYFALIFMLCGGAAFGQTSSIQGVITDRDSKQPLAFVNVTLYRDGNVQTGTTTDFDGKYVLKPLEAGVYDLMFSYVGYQNLRVNGITVTSGKIKFVDQQMGAGVQLAKAEIVVYKEPLIDKDGGASGGTVSRENIAKMPGRSATSIATTVAGVGTAGTGGGISIRGARSNSTWVYIDGIKVRGSSALPKSAIQEVAVLTGGIPANIGDATGGVINISLRGASKQFAGGVELITSGFKSGETAYGLDRYGFNLVEASLTGPLLFKKDDEGNKTDPLLGFFVSGNYQSQVDPRPTFGGVYRMKEDVRQEMFANPLVRNQSDGGGALYATSFLGEDDFEQVPTRLNVGNQSANLVAKIDVATNETMNLTFGATGSMARGHGFSYGNMLMNWENNQEFINYDWRVYGKFSQRFIDSEEESEASNLKNVFYTLMVDYSKSFRKNQDDTHQDDYFKYGHVGKFDVLSQRSYTYDPATQAYYQNGYEDTLVIYNPSEFNPILSSINNQYFDLFDQQPYNTFNPGPYSSLLEVQNGNGLLNGESPSSIYGLWNYGGTPSGYNLTDNSQFRVTANGSADVGDHALQIGFEYEQRRDAGFALAPTGLWNLGRLLSNSHIEAINEDDFWITYPEGTQPYYNYGKLIGDNQFKFDYKVREALGLNPNGDNFINIDALDPSFFNLDFFSADELLNQGQSLVNYYGFDAFGNKNRSRYTLNDFFTETDELGYRTRPVGAFEPIYMSGYIMDKFAFDDIIFNVGLRIDRYDANQNVLKDPYVLGEPITAGETLSLAGETVTHPSNIGDDFVVYVDDIDNPSSIIGYRENDQWYDATGAQVDNPSVIESTGRPAPYIVGGSENSLSESAFNDYEPQVNWMPRIAFSFPISDEALFFAHYDILTQRPTASNRFNPVDYLFLGNSNSPLINNPNLKPTKTIDYELGFQQVLSPSSSLKISAFYRELRDMIQIRNYSGAYPSPYRTYGNLDFGNTKGLTVSYDLRRTGNIWMKVNYTLQFAEGTGSNQNTALALINAGLPNLRTVAPVSFDQRHNIVATVDYRYGEGTDYNGPSIGGKPILENTGVNFIANLGSGTPYTAARDPFPITGEISPSTEGSINGSRLPWTFNIDMNIDKTWMVKLGKGEDAKAASLNVYLWFQNLLNTRNINTVYRFTGTADDDGYLAAAEYQTRIENQLDPNSYSNYYRMFVDNPFNLNAPRRIRLGVSLNF